jgi:Mg2+-importing ATPase
VDKWELRRPRSYNVREVVLIAMILGLVSTVFDFIFFGLFFRRGPEVLQTNWFIGSVITELFLIFSIRTRGFWLKAKFPSRALALLSVVAFAGAILLPISPWGQRLFHFIRPTQFDLILIVIVALTYFVVTEGVSTATVLAVAGVLDSAAKTV